VIQKPVVEQDTEGQANQVKEEVAVIVDANAIVDPGAMAETIH
jgi:hypothetical protein